jgi:hypothetical protein
MAKLIVEKNPNEVGSTAAWQNIINGCGYNPALIITGYFDNETVAATKKFQTDVELKSTGEVDLKTWQTGLSHKKIEGWSEATPPISVRRNRDADVDVFWSKQELTERVVQKAKELGLPLKTQWAYLMATIEWETANTFEPVREAFWMSETWRENNLRYYPYYGRGYVQLTWEDNYQSFADFTGLDLVGNPDLVMQPDTALFVLVYGLKHGTFGARLENHVTVGKTDYFNARRSVNLTDKAETIAEIARKWESRL